MIVSKFDEWARRVKWGKGGVVAKFESSEPSLITCELITNKAEIPFRFARIRATITRCMLVAHT
jgi:hypothetical protein